MTYTIKDNNGNMVFSIENVDPDVSYESINNDINNLSDYTEKLNKSLEAFNLISNTKAMESFGYRATEGFGDKVKAAGKVIWEKVNKFFNWVADIFSKFIAKIRTRFVSAQAVKKVLNNVKNPTDLVKKPQFAKIKALIESDKMSEYVAIQKNKNKIEKISSQVLYFRIKDQTDENYSKAEQLASELENVKEDAKRVRDNEKLTAAIDYYKISASKGSVFLIDVIEQKKKEALETKNKIEASVKDMMDNGGQGDYRMLNTQIKIQTSIYNLYVTEISVIYSLENAALEALKNEAVSQANKGGDDYRDEQLDI